MSSSVPIVLLSLISLAAFSMWEETCPQNCRCSVQPNSLIELDAKTVSCVGVLLMDVPQNISSDSEVIDLSSNVIGFKTDVSLKSFLSTENLKVLDLSYNRIRTFLSASKPIGQLALFNLSHNEIQSVNRFMFKDLKLLQYLDLENNSISRIALSSLDLPQLVYLNLKRNRIVSLRADFIFGTPKLNTLLLSNNILSRIPNRILKFTETLDIFSLNGNRINRIEDFAFEGIKTVGTLDLSGNSLKQVPTIPLQKISSIRLISLDYNDMKTIPSMAFDSVNVSQVSLSNLEDLLVVESKSFYNMSHLSTVWIKSNHRLTYISRGAFYDVPSLQVVDLRNNNLYVLEQSALQFGTRKLSLYVSGNPFLCDCNLKWIHDIVYDRVRHGKITIEPVTTTTTTAIPLNVTETTHHPNVTESPGNGSYDGAVDDARVAGDTSYVGSYGFRLSDSELRNVVVEDEVVAQCFDRVHDKSVKLPDLQEVQSECSPFLLPLFQPVDRAPVSATVNYMCRGIGVPLPYLKWKLPSGKLLSNNQCDDRICVHDETLIIQYLHEQDGGVYECVATSSQGTFKRSLHLEVFNVNIKIIPLSITSTFVTLAWNTSTYVTSDFMIQYKLASDGEDAYQLVPVSSKVFSYTLNRLSPGRTYTIWLCLHRDSYYIRVCSLTVTMKDDDFLAVTGIRRNYVSFILLVIISSSLMLTCLCFCALRAWRWRKLRQLDDVVLNDASTVVTQASVVTSDSVSNNLAFIAYTNDDCGLLENEDESSQ